MRNVFAVRQKSTGRYLPAPTGRSGGSYAEPTALLPPRIFKNHHSAACYMRAWLQGHFKMVSFPSSHESFYHDDVELQVTPVEGRSADDMEVVELQLVEVTK